jgi:2-oxo-4-hydroxy-4-carboxy-5-ureidoimidazoline decarboxylase
VINLATAEIGPIAVAEFDAARPADAAAELVPCCASRRWVSKLVAGRPYRRLDGLSAASDRVLSRLDWRDVEEALTAHPRIGDGVSGPTREAGWSRQEQAGTAGTSPDTRQALIDGNLAYERRFGHVFLICATGLSAEVMLGSLQSRLHNDPVAEREVVRAELAKIVRLRLARAFH